MQAREDKAGASNLLFYAPLESVLQHDGKYVSKVRSLVAPTSLTNSLPLAIVLCCPDPVARREWQNLTCFMLEPLFLQVADWKGIGNLIPIDS